jgi:hypothetical protein
MPRQRGRPSTMERDTMLKLGRSGRLLLFVVGVCTALAAGPAAARTWLVDDDRAECPTADFTRVQAAVDAAASGDTIRLCPGLYRENVTVLNKSLIFQGDSTERVIVDGFPAEPVGTFPSNLNVFTVRATNGQGFTCRFTGLTIRRGRYGILAQDTESGGGRAGSRMSLDVEKCVFLHNGYDGVPYSTLEEVGNAEYTVHATDGGAVRGEGDNSRVVENQIEANDRAITFEFGRQLQIVGNQIRGNLQPGVDLGRRRAANAAAVVSDVTVRGNHIQENHDAGVRVRGGARVVVEANGIDRNWNSGLMAYDCETLTLRQNRVSENSLVYINGVGSLTPDAFGGIGITDPFGAVVIADNDIRANHPGLLVHTAGGVRISKSVNVSVSLTGNTLFANDGDGVLIEGNGAGVRITGNNLTSNIGFGVNNRTATEIDASRNWWASSGGPRAAVATADNPEQVSGRLIVRPWTAAPIAYPVIRVTPAP